MEPQILYYENKNSYSEEWTTKLDDNWNADRVLHREDGPAKIWYYEDGIKHHEEWYINGIYTRDNGPAVIWYYQNGEIQHEDWYTDGKFDRLDKPARIDYYRNGKIKQEEWWIDGNRNKSNGPAIKKYNEDGTHTEVWYICGNEIEIMSEWLLENNIKAPYTEEDAMAITLRWS